MQWRQQQAHGLMQGVDNDRGGDHADDLNIVSAIKLRRNLLVKPGLGESTRISAYAVNKVDHGRTQGAVVVVDSGNGVWAQRLFALLAQRAAKLHVRSAPFLFAARR